MVILALRLKKSFQTPGSPLRAICWMFRSGMAGNGLDNIPEQAGPVLQPVGQSGTHRSFRVSSPEGKVGQLELNLKKKVGFQGHAPLHPKKRKNRQNRPGKLKTEPGKLPQNCPFTRHYGQGQERYCRKLHAGLAEQINLHESECCLSIDAALSFLLEEQVPSIPSERSVIYQHAATSPWRLCVADTT